jgi:hypothetical protein
VRAGGVWSLSRRKRPTSPVHSEDFTWGPYPTPKKVAFGAVLSMGDSGESASRIFATLINPQLTARALDCLKLTLRARSGLDKTNSMARTISLAFEKTMAR